MKCKDCYFNDVSEYDPSPSGIHLGAGTFQDWSCNHPDFDFFPEDNDGTNCQFGIPMPLRCCQHHGAYTGSDCPECLKEQYEAEAQADKDAEEYYKEIGND